MFWDGPNVKNRRRKECRWAGDLETGAEHDNVSSRTATVQSSRGNADVAQLVAHHLAKVRVASSSLVIRSKYIRVLWRKLHGGLVEWLGNGLQNRVHGFDSRIHLQAGNSPRD